MDFKSVYLLFEESRDEMDRGVSVFWNIESKCYEISKQCRIRLKRFKDATGTPLESPGLVLFF